MENKMNILVTNENTDIDISYYKSGISNYTDISAYIKNERRIFDESIIDAFDTILMLGNGAEAERLFNIALDLHDSYKFLYKVEDSDWTISLTNFALSEAFSRFIEIFDLSKYMTVIDKSGNETIFNNAKDPVFLKIKNNLMENADVLVAFENNHYQSPDLLKWSEKSGELVNKASHWWKDDFQGFKNTADILKYPDMPAAEYCNKQEITIGETVYKGYLPADCEMLSLTRYNALFNYVFKRFGSTDTINEEPGYWTSTERDSNNVISWHLDGSTFNTIKIRPMWVIPFFHEITE